MKWKEIIISILTFGLNILIKFINNYNSLENKIARLHGKSDKKKKKHKKVIKNE